MTNFTIEVRIYIIENLMCWLWKRSSARDFDIGGKARGVAAGLDDACDQLDIDLVVGTDAGEDVLAAGDESGTRVR